MILGETHYYEISLLGLMWLSERDGERDRTRSLSPILYTLKEVGIIDEKQRKAARANLRLRDRFLRKIDICRIGAGEEGKELDERVVASLKHLILPLTNEDPFDRRRLIAPHGYKFVLSNGGRTVAESKEGPYANIVTRAQFLSGHAAMRERVALRMAAINAKRGKAARTTVEDDEDLVDIAFGNVGV